MNDNLTRFFALPVGLHYTEGVKLLLCGGSLYKNETTGRVFIRLKFKNVSKKVVKGIKVGFTLYDYLGDKIGEEREYTYIDLSGGYDAELCSETPVYLKDKNTRGFSVRVLEVGYNDDRETYDGIQIWHPVPTQKELGVSLDEETVRQYKMELGGMSKYFPQSFEGLVSCSCGAIGVESEDNCRACGCKYDALLNADIAAISENARVRVEKAMEEERIRLEKEQEEARIREEKRKEMIDKIIAFLVKYKKWLIIGISSLIALIVAISIITSYVTRLGIYNDAVLARSEERFDDSIKLLEQIPGFKDSEALIDEISAERDNYFAYDLAEDYFKAGKYKDAVKAFENLAGYKDSAERMEEVVRTVIEKAQEKAKANMFGEVSKLITQVSGYFGVEEATNEIYDQWCDFILSKATEEEVLTAESFKGARDKIIALVPLYANRQAKIDSVGTVWREYIGTVTDAKKFDVAYPLAKEYAACYPSEEATALYESMDEAVLSYAEELATSGSYYEAVETTRILLDDYPDVTTAKMKDLMQRGAKALASRGVLGENAKPSLLFNTIGKDGCVLTDEGGILIGDKIYGYGNVSVVSDYDGNNVFALRVDGKVVCCRYIKEKYQGLVDILQTDVNNDIVSIAFDETSMILVKADGTVKHFVRKATTQNKKTVYTWEESDKFKDETEIAYATDTVFLCRKNGTVAFDEYWVVDVHKNTFRQLTDVRKIINLNMIAPSASAKSKQMFICLKNNGTIRIIENGHSSFTNASIAKLKNMGLNDIVDIDYHYFDITFIKRNGSYFSVDENSNGILVIGETKSADNPVSKTWLGLGGDSIIYKSGLFEYDGKTVYNKAMVYAD